MSLYYYVQGALSVLLSLAVSVEASPVVFKLLATIRMLVAGCTPAALTVMCSRLHPGRTHGNVQPFLPHPHSL